MNEPEPVQALIMGLRKCVKSDETEWVDANIIRMLLGNYEDDVSENNSSACGAGEPAQ